MVDQADQHGVGDAVTDPRGSVRALEGETRRQKLAELAWAVVGQRVFRLTFHNWYGLRNRILGVFGARVDPSARIRPSAKITHPWNLSVGAHTAVGDKTILWCIGPVSIGARCTVSQLAHLCSGSYDYTKRAMPLLAEPITIGDDVWIASDVFVGPGVTIGEMSVVGSRSTVFNDLPAKRVCVGDSAKPIAERVLN